MIPKRCRWVLGGLDSPLEPFRAGHRELSGCNRDGFEHAAAIGSREAHFVGLANGIMQTYPSGFLDNDEGMKMTNFLKERAVFMALMALLMVPSVADAQVYKCMEGGRTVFTDKPCAAGAKPISVQPASGRAAVAGAPETTDRSYGAAAATAPQSYVDKADQAARRRVLQNQITRKEGELSGLEHDMNREMDRLRGQRRRAANNLAGATWETSLAQEMTAVTNSYAARMDIVREDIARLRMEREAIPE